MLILLKVVAKCLFFLIFAVYLVIRKCRQCLSKTVLHFCLSARDTIIPSNDLMAKKYFCLLILLGFGLSGLAREATFADGGHWYQVYNDTLKGLGLPQAMGLIKGRKLKVRHPVTVAIIDSGVDTLCLQQQKLFWCNPKDRKDGVDNDKNGYVDDVNGWNFLGTRDGQFNMTSAGTQEFRIFKKLYPKYKDMEGRTITDSTEYRLYEEMKRKAGIVKYVKYAVNEQQKSQAYRSIDSLLRCQSATLADTVKVATLLSMYSLGAEWEKDLVTLMADFYKAEKSMTWHDLMAAHAERYALVVKRLKSIEREPDKRLLMGDDIHDAKDVRYGNATLKVKGFEHGTASAGLVASSCGINDAVRLMILRAVPDGDEYDKDVATAIRYAVDNGAKVINMSLGKYASTDPSMVTDAIKYAASHDVLIVQSAGNHKKNIDEIEYFPIHKDKRGVSFDNYIVVGASDKKGERCDFSNYGARTVDLMAPGKDIRIITGHDTSDLQDGTSLSAPIVSGVAALLRGLFPRLTAAETRRILLQSVTPINNLSPFCRTSGVIHAGRAVQQAFKIKNKKS